MESKEKALTELQEERRHSRKLSKHSLHRHEKQQKKHCKENDHSRSGGTLRSRHGRDEKEPKEAKEKTSQMDKDVCKNVRHDTADHSLAQKAPTELQKERRHSQKLSNHSRHRHEKQEKKHCEENNHSRSGGTLRSQHRKDEKEPKEAKETTSQMDRDVYKNVRHGTADHSLAQRCKAGKKNAKEAEEKKSRKHMKDHDGEGSSVERPRKKPYASAQQRAASSSAHKPRPAAESPSATELRCFKSKFDKPNGKTVEECGRYARRLRNLGATKKPYFSCAQIWQNGFSLTSCACEPLPTKSHALPKELLASRHGMWLQVILSLTQH